MFCHKFKSLFFAVLLPIIILNTYIPSVRANNTSAPKVVVTIKPLHSLVAGVMKDIAKPYLLLKGATSPHSFHLKPSAAQKIAKADLIVRVGPTLETSLNRVLSSLSKPEKILNVATIKDLIRYQSRYHHPHLHNKNEHGQNEHSKNEGSQNEGSQNGKNEKKSEINKIDSNVPTDPHVWLEIKNARLIVLSVATALSQIDPANQKLYSKNASKILNDLNTLTKFMEYKLHPLKGRRFMVFHDAYQYLTSPYKLKFSGALTLNPATPPSAKHLKDLRHILGEEKVSCVFTEPQYNSKIIRTLIDGTNAKITQLDPIGTKIPAGIGAYSAMMKQLANKLKTCLSP